MAKDGILRRHHGGESFDDASCYDLGSMTFADQELALEGKGTVHIAEILRIDELRVLSKPVYEGDIVLLDYTSIANDRLAVRQMTQELKNIARDTGGDVAGIAKDLLCLTPAGIRIDRQKLRPSL